MRWFVAAYLLAASAAYAQDALRDAVEAAWARQPGARAQPHRAEEFNARRAAAQAPFPEPPSLSLSNRDDRFHRNEGSRELEAAIALPLWLPEEKARQGAIVDAERSQYETDLATAKLKVAGKVRDAYWQARLAQSELALARRKADETALLATDVERRVKAGDLARVDLNQAQGAERLAHAAVAEAEARVFRARQAFDALTGRTAPPAAEENPAPAHAALDRHPLLASLQRAVATAQARLSLASQSLRNNPELELALRRERGLAEEPYAHSLEVRFRLPLATDARNKPRIAAANAELIEREAAYGIERARIASEMEAARRDLEQSRTVVRLAEARFALAADTQRLLVKAFELGEIDLFTRLRAENERFEAELNSTRARLEAARAVSRLNQALGVLP